MVSCPPSSHRHRWRGDRPPPCRSAPQGPALTLGLALALALIGALGAAACSTTSAAPRSSTGAGRRIQVVAAENVWGSIARQLGGTHAEVVSIIDRPNTDPHDYEPTAADGRTVAEAQFVISNGVGYDPWMLKLVAANDADDQHTLDIGKLLGLHVGDNPHRWYFPADVEAVIDRITADYQRIDPANSDYFAHQKQQYETVGLAEYHRLIGDIKATYAGTPVGASESIFEGIAEATGLHLVTPTRYLAAISQGADPTAGVKATVDRQVSGHEIDVWVYNRQNATPDTQELTHAAERAHIPVTTVTETLVPANATFQQWQSAQLRSLSAALADARPR